MYRLLWVIIDIFPTSSLISFSTEEVERIALSVRKIRQTQTLAVVVRKCLHGQHHGEWPPYKLGWSLGEISGRETAWAVVSYGYLQLCSGCKKSPKDGVQEANDLGLRPTSVKKDEQSQRSLQRKERRASQGQ